MLYSISWSNFTVGLSLLLAILGNMYCKCLLTRLWRHKFSIFISFHKKVFIKLFFYMIESQDKNFIILKTKRAFKMKQKAFFIIFKELSNTKTDQVYSNTRVSTQVNRSQKESTRFNTNQHKSDTNQHESDTSQHESTRINTSQHESDTSQHESDTSQQESARV